MTGENHVSKNQLYVTGRDEWRQWLKEHNTTASVIWLIFYKKETGRPIIPYDDSVEEALCFGWIDSIVKKIDEQRYMRKFTPRNTNSVWSEPNKTRVDKMIRAGRMTPAGQEKIDAAKKNGKWNQPDRPRVSLEPPPEFIQALNKNQKARQNFEKMAPSYKKFYIGWIASAKRPETRDKRIKESIQLLKQGRKLGMK